MADVPARFCEICGVIHEPPIHHNTCAPVLGARIYWTPLLDTDVWPTQAEIHAGLAYWDAVFQDKGTKPLS